MIKKVILFLFLIQWSFAQQTTLDELNNLSINAITKDDIGRIWLATSNGLYGYDGSMVLKFNSRSLLNPLKYDDLNGIVYNHRTKKIIITTSKGLVVFDPNSFTNKEVLLDTNRLKVQRNYFIQPCIDEKGFTWFANQEGYICRLDEQLRIKKYNASVPIPLSLKVRYNTSFSIGQLSITNNKLFYYTTQSIVSSFELNTKEAKAISYGNRAYISTIEKKDHRIIFDFNGIHVRKLNDTIDQKFIPRNIINMVITDVDGDIWYVMNKTHVYKLKSDFNSELVYELNIDLVNKHRHISSLFVDRKRIWLGTGRGLIMINKPNKAFNKIFQSLEDYTSSELSSRGIIAYNDSIIVCGGYNFLVKYNVASNRTETMISKKEAQNVFPYAFYRSNDSLIIAGEGSGLKLFDLKLNKFMPIRYKNTYLMNHYSNGGLFTSICKVDSFLLMGEYGFLGAYNFNTKHLNNNVESDWQFPWFKDKCNGITQILNLNRHEILFVSNGKIYITDKKLHVKFRIELSDPKNELQDLKVYNVMVDKEGGFWFATDKNGICHYNRDSGKKQWYSADNGLSDNSVYYSLQSNDGRVWVATNFGLSVIDPHDHIIKKYFEEDGIANNEFNKNSFYKAGNGDLYFGGMKGVTRIIPSDLEITSESDELILNSIHMAGHISADSTYLSGLSQLQNITLPYHSRFLKVSFALLNYSNKNKYEFRLLGSDSTWISLGNSSQVMFNSLEPGSYTLEIRAWNERGDLASNQIKLSLNVEQVFYLKAWFILICVALFVIITGLIFYTIYRIKIKGINQMAEMRLKIATDLHDQVGGLLNKTATQAEVVQMKLKGEDNSLSKIADNSRVALNSMRDIMWNLDPRNDDPESLVVRMSEYAQTMLDDSNMYELHLNVLKEVKLPQETRQIIITVFKEAITNIVKHAPGERVLVTAELNKDQLSIVIHNTGSFKTKNEFSGQGLRNMKMRIERVGGQFLINTSDGVRLTISLKI